MVRNKKNIVSRITSVWLSGYGRGYRRGAKVWKRAAEDEIARIEQEYQGKLDILRKFHDREKRELVQSAEEAIKKLRKYKENIDRVEVASSALVSLLVELKMSVAGAFQRAMSNQGEIENIIRADKRIEKKEGGIQ